jgi:hypothetical protein
MRISDSEQEYVVGGIKSNFRQGAIVLRIAIGLQCAVAYAIFLRYFDINFTQPCLFLPGLFRLQTDASAVFTGTFRWRQGLFQTQTDRLVSDLVPRMC